MTKIKIAMLGMRCIICDRFFEGGESVKDVSVPPDAWLQRVKDAKGDCAIKSVSGVSCLEH